MSVERCSNGSAHCTACDCRWFPYGSGVCEVCSGARRVPHVARPASRFTRDQLDALTAQVRAFEPIPVYEEVPAKDWQDTAQADAWGARPRGHQVLSRTWAGGNCLKACIASLLDAPIKRIPDPTVEYNEGLPGWFERYDKRLQAEISHRLERLPRSLCPPKNRGQLWIAAISMPDHDADHVVVARGYYAVHDPLGEFIGSLPWDRIIDGMIVTPTRRVVPVLSPLGSGYISVAA
jgi:hypothetical protein